MRERMCMQASRTKSVLSSVRVRLRVRVRVRVRVRAYVYAGISNQERPVVTNYTHSITNSRWAAGVRGEQKDLTRVARLLKSKWEHRKSGVTNLIQSSSSLD